VGTEFCTNPVMSSLIVLLGVTRPTVFIPRSVNHTSPSGPAAICCGELSSGSPVENSVITPVGVIRPIAAWVPTSVNHRLPSGPAVMKFGNAPRLNPALNLVIVPLGVIRAIVAGLVSTMKPNVAVGAAGDPIVLVVARVEIRRELGERTGRSHATDVPARVLGEPKVAVGPGNNRIRYIVEPSCAAPYSVTVPLVAMAPIWQMPG
jgi:hypothetical protein